MLYNNKILLTLLIFSSSLIPLSGCDDEGIDYEEVYIWVAPKKLVTNDGLGNVVKYLTVKILSEAEIKTKHPSIIEGFDYEEGYAYILYVRIVPNPDIKNFSPEAPTHFYTLIKTILKEKVN
jgi:hypothetical protein